jgi:hypothetical protein
MSEKNKLQEYCQKNKLQMPVYSSWCNGEPHCLQWSSNVTIKIGNKDVTIDTIVPCNSKTSAEKQAAMMMLDHFKSKKNNNLEKISNLSKLKQSTKLSISSTHKALFSNKLHISDDSNDDLVVVSSDKEDSILEISDSTDDDSKQSKRNLDERISLTTHKNQIENINPSLFNNIYLIDLENKPSFKSKLKSNALYIGFLNSIHHSIDKYKNWHICKTDNITEELLESYNNKLLYLIDGGTPDLVDHFITCFIYPIINYIGENNISPVINIISGDHAGWCTRTCLEKILRWRKINSIEIINAPSI